MNTCDICGTEVQKLTTSRRGPNGLDLCPICYRRLRSRQPTRQTAPAQLVEAAKQTGPDPDAHPAERWEWPLCEFCGEDVDQHGLGYYTTKRKPRSFCSILCRQTRNSRVGAPIRAHKARQRVRAGTWQNPATYQTPDERRDYARRGGAVRAEQHRAALEAGTWANPADAPGAREKLSRPRVHGDNPDLHRAIEKLRQGLSVADLTDAEAEAHRTYRSELRAADPGRFRQYGREAYRRRMATPEGQAKARASWKAERERLRQRPPNDVLRAARQQAGLSQAELARRVGVTQSAVGRWERHSAIPRSPQVRTAVADLLDCAPWPLVQTRA